MRTERSLPIQPMNGNASRAEQNEASENRMKEGGEKPAVQNQEASSARMDLLFASNRDFQALRHKLGGILDQIYDGTAGKSDFAKQMDALAAGYLNDQMPDSDKQAVIRTISAFSKLESNIAAGQRAMNDPEKMKKALDFQESVMQRQESGKQPAVAGGVPYKDWVNPKIIGSYKQSQSMISDWAEAFARHNGLDPAAVKTDNLNWGKWVVYGGAKSAGKGVIVDQST